jgi:hypothetical protein
MDGGEALDERTARRIIAMLVSFATLAERAAVRSFPVRWLVLCILRHAEIVGQNVVLDSAPWAWPYLEDERESGSSPMDAVLLGQRLRLLAAILAELLPVEDRPDVWAASPDDLRHCLPSGVLLAIILPHGRRPALHDTS